MWLSCTFAIPPKEELQAQQGLPAARNRATNLKGKLQDSDLAAEIGWLQVESGRLPSYLRRLAAKVRRKVIIADFFSLFFSSETILTLGLSGMTKLLHHYGTQAEYL